MAKFKGLGKALAALRTERGLNQRELAERAGVARGLMSQYESEQVSPSLPTLERLLEALAVSPRELIDKLETVQSLAVEGREVSIPRMTRVRKLMGGGPPGAYLMIPVALEELVGEETRRELVRLSLKDGIRAASADAEPDEQRRKVAEAKPKPRSKHTGKSA